MSWKAHIQMRGNFSSLTLSHTRSIAQFLLGPSKLEILFFCLFWKKVYILDSVYLPSCLLKVHQWIGLSLHNINLGFVGSVWMNLAKLFIITYIHVVQCWFIILVTIPPNLHMYAVQIEFVTQRLLHKCRYVILSTWIYWRFFYI